jgi:hypothetical protein
MFDARQNEIKVGDTVMLEIISKSVVGEIRDIENGGIITGINRKDHGMVASMGFVTVLVAFKIAVNPEQPIISNMHKLHTDGDGKPRLMQ